MFLGKRIGLAVVCFALSLAAASAAQMISVDRTGTSAGGGGLEEGYIINGDGRYVAFASSSTNHVANDTNGISDIFVYDCEARSNVWNTCYSVAAPNVYFASRPVDFTPDGRFLLFLSRATNHLPGLFITGIESYQLYVRDLVSNVTHLASAALDGTNVANWNYSGLVAVRGLELQYHRHRISSDGRYVVFASQGTNLVPEVTNAGWNLYRRDLVLQTTEVMTGHPGGVPVLDFGKDRFFSSTNARYVAFNTSTTNIVAGVTNNGQRFGYWRDRLAPTNVLLALTTNGYPATGDISIKDMTSDGRFVAFSSFATNLTTDVIDDNGTHDLFIRDMLLGEIHTVTRATNGHTTASRHQNARFSKNGEWLLFNADSADMAPGILDVNNNSSLFIHHLPTRTNGLINITPSGDRTAYGFFGESFANLSSSGRFTLLSSFTTNFVPGNDTYANRLYLRDQLAGTTRNAFHTGLFPTPPFNEGRHVISANERVIFFQSQGSFDPSVSHSNGSTELFRAPLYPPRITALNDTELHADAIAGATYVLESSSNLRHWSSIYTNAADAQGHYLAPASSPLPGNERFYRLLWP
jgi:Tol biopolymer transport system component